jgi:hypothetical protein
MQTTHLDLGQVQQERREQLIRLADQSPRVG